MRSPRIKPVVRRLPSNRPPTARERAIAKALASFPSLKSQDYVVLREALRLQGEDALDAALTDLLKALACTHVKCACLLKKGGDARDREAIASLATCGPDGSVLLARSFGRWCWRHRRKEERWSERERPSSAEARTDHERGSIADSLDHRAESHGLYPKAWNDEERADGTSSGRVFEFILSQSRCSEKEIVSFVEVKSRLKHDFESAASAPERSGARVAKRKMNTYLTPLGVLSFEDLEVAIEDGLFREATYGLTG